MDTYTCVHKIWLTRAGRYYDPGEPIELSEEEAAPLLDVGAIEPPEAPESEKRGARSKKRRQTAPEGAGGEGAEK